ncbi:dipeptidase [Fontivita pretiosa]|uniref:dipeptidase n=1 Tax=Fontivita pretiosa TaxID=2989684 RepID=UPI003D17CC69
MLIADAHLDLAFNALPQRGRDPRLPAKDQPVVDREIPTVGLPDLRAGGVGLICATIFCWPRDEHGGYSTAEEARAMALSQLAWYRSCIDQGLMRLVTSTLDIPRVTRSVSVPGDSENDNSTDAAAATAHAHGPASAETVRPLRAILLLEGADAIRTPDDLPEWFDAGLRIVGLAWKRTRYAGGTGAPGPLTPAGCELVRQLDRLGMIHDASHLAEESFWNLLDIATGPIIASHSNCRAIVGEGDRHLSDEMIRALIARGGVIGINFYDKFLIPRPQQGRRRATLNDVVNHVKHICDLAGDASHVGLGTDMDGGLGREQIPVEIRTSADLPRVAQALSEAGFGQHDVTAIMGGNWCGFFRASLPS